MGFILQTHTRTSLSLMNESYRWSPLYLLPSFLSCFPQFPFCEECCPLLLHTPAPQLLTFSFLGTPTARVILVSVIRVLWFTFALKVPGSQCFPDAHRTRCHVYLSFLAPAETDAEQSPKRH